MLIVFTLMHVAPGNPVDMYFGGPDADEVLVEELLAKYGFDRPLWEQFLIWFNHVIRGDLGFSFITDRPVSELIWERLGNTLLLMFTSVALSITVGILLGAITAYKQHSPLDSFTRIFIIVGRATPSFWMGLMAMLVFGVWLDWVPVSGIVTLGKEYQGPLGRTMDVLTHMILPVSILAYSFMAGYVRQMRANMLQVLNEDYIRTARAKGLRELIVVGKHAMKNALLPIVTMIGMNMGRIIGGSVMIETIFSWPGIGTLTTQSILRRDYSIVMGIILIIGIIIVVSNLVTDICYKFLDPRIKY